MDQMNQQIDQYLEKLVNECLQAPAYANLPDDRKQSAKDKIRNQLYQVVINLVIDRLNEEQLSELEVLDPESPEMEAKIEEFAAQIPNLAQDLNQKLQEEVASIKNQPFL